MSFDDSSEIERLRRELEKITAERDYLLVENRRLTQISQVNQAPIRAITNELVKEAILSGNTVKLSDSISSLNSESPLSEKIMLFRSLFHGREDVYATLWQNKTTLKSGYSPVGRLHRLHAGKTDVRIYDYVDRNVPMLVKMYQKRLRGYRAMGYELDKSDNSNKINMESLLSKLGLENISPLR